MELNFISENIKYVKEKINNLKDKYKIKNEIKIVAVSKTKPIEYIIKAYESGIKDFGENRIQEGVEKIQKLNELNYNINWHMIGALQRNKAKKAIEYFNLIQSVDREVLVERMIYLLEKSNSKKEILIEINSSNEPQKSGVTIENFFRLVDFILENGKKRLLIKGVMTIGPLTDNIKEISNAFKKTYVLFEKLKEEYAGVEEVDPIILSMGMSADFDIAIAEGSNMVRLGSIIFGPRT